MLHLGRSLGLAIPPRIKCLEKHQRYLLQKKNKQASNKRDESSSDDESAVKAKPIDDYKTKNIFKDGKKIFFQLMLFFN